MRTDAASTSGLVDAAANGSPHDLSDGDPRRNDPAAGASWPVDREIDANVIYELCATESAARNVHARGIHIIGARVVGPLRFEAAKLRVPLTLEKCLLVEEVTLDRAEAPVVSLIGCCVPRITACDLRISAGFDLSSVNAGNGVMLRGAAIGGTLSTDGATLGEPAAGEELAGVGLDARGVSVGGDLALGSVTTLGLNIDLAQVTGDLTLRDATLAAPLSESAPDARALSGRGCTIGGDLVLDHVDANGQVSLAGAEIRGSVRCTRTSVRAAPQSEERKSDAARGPTALDAQGISVGGHISLRDEFAADGEVNLLGAVLGTGLECRDATFTNREGVALNAQGLRAGSNVLLTENLSVDGELVLAGADVGGTLDVHATIRNKGHVSIRADLVKVGGSALLHAGCTAEGEVRLAGAEIGADLDCRGATFDNPNGTAFTIEGAHVKRTFWWGPFQEKGSTSTDNQLFFGVAPADWSEDQPRGTIDFRRARVSRLVDHWTTWTYDPDLELDGFTYEELGDSAAPLDLRLRWLTARAARRPERIKIDWAQLGFEYEVPQLPQTGHYSPQPFEQLAAVYERIGDTEAARRTRIHKERCLRLSGNLKPRARLSNWILDATIRYGWAPSRVVILGLLIIAVCALVFASAGVAGFAETSRDQPSRVFDPLVYSLDTFLPVIDLRQQSAWLPRSTVEWRPMGWTTSGLVLHYFIWFELIAGWVISTLAVTAFTGLVRKK